MIALRGRGGAALGGLAREDIVEQLGAVVLELVSYWVGGGAATHLPALHTGAVSGAQEGVGAEQPAALKPLHGPALALATRACQSRAPCCERTVQQPLEQSVWCQTTTQSPSFEHSVAGGGE